MLANNEKRNGVSFQLFYKPLVIRGEPTKVFSSNYNENDKVGIELGNLLQRETYDESKLKAFCDSLLEDYCLILEHYQLNRCTTACVS